MPRPKKLNVGSKYIISHLPEALINHILSFLPTKEAAKTSVLSKQWRYLFAFSPNLDFDDPILMQPDLLMQDMDNDIRTTFIKFVDTVLGRRGNIPINKFSLKCGICVPDICVICWILDVLELGVSELDLRVAAEWLEVFPSQVFVNKSLVSLRIGARNVLAFGIGLTISVGDVFLPKLKSLYLDSVGLADSHICLAKLLSACHVLEELVLINLVWNHWESCSVSNPTITRLTFCIDDDHHHWHNPKSVTFDTPALVYLEYTDTVAVKYEKVNFDSLVEARLRLRLGFEETNYAIEVDGAVDILTEYTSAGDATDLLKGISCSVQILYLNASTIQVLAYSCEEIPIFTKLTHLTIESNENIGWDELPNLLKNSPNLETLIFQGVLHQATDRCGDVCLCKPSENIPTCLSSSPVKVLKIFKFGETDDAAAKKELEQIKHFLESMPHLEELIIHSDKSTEDNLVNVSNQLQETPRVASAKCKIQVISDNLNLSFTVPSSSS